MGPSSTLIDSLKINYIDLEGIHSISNFTNGRALGTHGGLCYIESITYNLVANSSTQAQGSISGIPQLILGNEVTYIYTEKGCFESKSTLNGKIVNHYNAIDFPNKWQWGQACGLPIHKATNTNYG